MPFLSSDDELAIVQAIQEAEKKPLGKSVFTLKKNAQRKTP